MYTTVLWDLAASSRELAVLLEVFHVFLSQVK
jgi:hypothetical protein